MSANDCRQREINEEEHVTEECQQQRMQLAHDGLDNERRGLPDERNSNN
jgi:hypothetical protein